MSLARTLSATVASACLATACASSPPHSPFGVSSGGAALPPIGFLRLCEKTPNECYDSQSRSVALMARRLSHDLGGANRSASPAAIREPGRERWAGLFAAAEVVNNSAPASDEARSVMALTPANWERLLEVNDLVNARVISRSDQQAFGVPDYWQLPFRSLTNPVGDCEDYVLQKRRLLIDAGFAPATLSIAIVKIGGDVTHAVLLVETEQGGYVLDSLTPRVIPWTKSRYRWLERQVNGEAFSWTFGPPTEEFTRLSK